LASLLAGAVIFFTHGEPSTLNPANEEQRLEQCDIPAEAFSDGSAEDCVASVQRALERDAEDTRSDMLTWLGGASLAVLLLGLIFMIKIVQRAETAGTRADFRSLRSDWFLYLGLVVVASIIAGVLAHGSFFGGWAGALTSTRGWAIPAILLAFWAGTFVIGTKLATPQKMQPSIPF